MRTFVLEEVGVDQGHNPSAQRLILFTAVCVEDLKPDLEIRVADEKCWVVLNAVFWALQEPALIRTRVFYIETRIQALDEVSGETIIDPRTIVLAKDDPGFTVRIPDDVLPISSRRAMKSVHCDDGLMGFF